MAPSQRCETRHAIRVRKTIIAVHDGGRSGLYSFRLSSAGRGASGLLSGAKAGPAEAKAIFSLSVILSTSAMQTDGGMNRLMY